MLNNRHSEIAASGISAYSIRSEQPALGEYLKTTGRVLASLSGVRFIAPELSVSHVWELRQESHGALRHVHFCKDVQPLSLSCWESANCSLTNCQTVEKKQNKTKPSDPSVW